MKNAPPAFAKESDLCAAFIAVVPEGWTAYPETAGWDILLVRNDDGFQIGVEAKLKLSAKVLRQAIESETHHYSEHTGPDCRAVLVPDGACSEDMIIIAMCLQITVLRMRGGPRWADINFRYNDRFTPRLPIARKGYWFGDDWFERAPLERCRVPDYVPDVGAGKPSPRRLSEWKIKAIKIVIVLARRGYVTRRDFVALKISMSRWTQSQWLVFGAGRGQWIAGPAMPDFRTQHPTSYAEIEADFEAWKPRNEAAQGKML